MANLRLGMAFAGLTLALLVFMQLLAVVRYNDRVPVGSFDRNFNQWRGRASAATDDGVFLVGAGKADVTGYACAHGPLRLMIDLLSLTPCLVPSLRLILMAMLA